MKEAFDFSLYLNSKNGSRYGLGWRIIGDEEGRGIISHRGSLGGFKSLLWRDINNKNTLIVLSNNWWLVDVPEIIWSAQDIMEGKECNYAKVSIQALFLDNWSLYGFEAALHKIKEVINNNPSQYNYSESLVNDLGYYFLYERDEPLNALQLLKLNADLYPNSYNVYDSLGEVYMNVGNTLNAKSNYEKALEMNPSCETAKKALKKLGETVN